MRNELFMRIRLLFFSIHRHLRKQKNQKKNQWKGDFCVKIRKKCRNSKATEAHLVHLPEQGSHRIQSTIILCRRLQHAKHVTRRGYILQKSLTRPKCSSSTASSVECVFFARSKRGVSEHFSAGRRSEYSRFRFRAQISTLGRGWRTFTR